MANITQLRLSGTTYTIVDSTAVHSLAGYATEESVQTSITALAESIAEQGYQTATDVENAISGKADTSAVTEVNNTITAHTANTSIHVTVADKTAWNAKLDAADVENFFGAVNYDSNSKRINFYNTSTGGTVLAYVDATDFIKDGFLQSVTIENKTISGESVPCLVFIWNTDSGLQETDIPLSGIFDASNYYNKTEVDNLLAAKANTATTYTKTEVDNALNEKADTTAVTESINAAVSGKQDTLVSGTNIKTVNNQSLLGSGNITIEGGTIDQTVISGSTNAVAGGAVYTALTNKNGVITLDGETLIIS